MSKVKTKITLLILLSPFFFFSQESENTTLIINYLKKNEFKNALFFNKAQSFYLKKEWDSTLIYSMKQLNESHNNELADYCHFFRCYSLFNKKLFKEALSEMKLVSNNFLFNNLVNNKLGEITIELKDYKKAIEYFKKTEKLSITKKPDRADLQAIRAHTVMNPK
jgi:tetratricopeptide (TPR) repeat protein